ncbi:MAG: dihydropteridine reductase [Oscillospiraceae bacterium]|nr:dihydropteridine reductase [Oscillospiraceae bacterium]
MNTDKIYAQTLASEYAPKDTSKILRLKRLDAKAKMPATVFTYTLGIISALVMGVGMCLSMKVIGDGSTVFMIAGIILGILGMIGAGVNYPIYKKKLEKNKQKYAFEIMELAKDIAKSED